MTSKHEEAIKVHGVTQCRPWRAEAVTGAGSTAPQMGMPTTK